MKITEVIEGVFDTVKSTLKKPPATPILYQLDRYEQEAAAFAGKIIDMVDSVDVQHVWDGKEFEKHVARNKDTDRFREVHREHMEGIVVRIGSKAEKKIDELMVLFLEAQKKVEYLERKIGKHHPKQAPDPDRKISNKPSYPRTKAEKRFGKEFAHREYARYRKLKTKKNRTKREQDQLDTYERQLKDLAV